MTFASKTLLAAVLACTFTTAIAADQFPAALQAKVDKYKMKLVEWAANPAIIGAVKESNARGALPGMTNAKWLDVADNDPAAQAYVTSKAGSMVKKWEEDKDINKLVVRDEKGNLVAASTKPLLYNNAVRPVYIHAMKGQPWVDGKVAPDPTTQIKSVQASAPVLEGGKVIGVIHVGVTTE